MHTTVISSSLSALEGWNPAVIRYICTMRFLEGAAARGGNRGAAGGRRASFRACFTRQQRRLAVPHDADEEGMPVQEGRHVQLVSRQGNWHFIFSLYFILSNDFVGIFVGLNGLFFTLRLYIYFLFKDYYLCSKSLIVAPSDVKSRTRVAKWLSPKFAYACFLFESRNDTIYV